MKKKIIAICFVFMAVATTSLSLVSASEISGTISNETYQGSMTGNVISAPVQSSGGGGGGGSIVIPLSSYSYEDTNSSYGNVALFSQPMKFNNTVVSDRLAQRRDEIIDEISTDTATSEEDFFESSGTTTASDAIPYYEESDLTPTQTDMTTEGAYDFLGISAWFWLVVLLLLILIIVMTFMQKQY